MNKIKLPLLIHIGYPKTATTTIQKYVFTHESIIHLDNLTEKLYSHAVIFQNEIPFENSLSQYRFLIKQEINSHSISKPKAKTVVLSNENFISNSMVFRTFPASFYWSPDPAAIARKLSLLFGKDFITVSPKIIITIRKQADLLKSCYAQYYNYAYKKNKNTNNFKKFISYSYQYNYDNFIGAAINYNQVITFYEKLFHKENIIVFVYEDLIEDPIEFSNCWAQLLELPENIVQSCLKRKENVKKVGENVYKKDTRSLLRAINPATYDFLKKIDRIIPSTISTKIKNKLREVEMEGKNFVIDFENETEIMNRYSEDNMKLADRYDLNLKKYDYY